MARCAGGRCMQSRGRGELLAVTRPGGAADQLYNKRRNCSHRETRRPSASGRERGRERWRQEERAQTAESRSRGGHASTLYAQPDSARTTPWYAHRAAAEPAVRSELTGAPVTPPARLRPTPTSGSLTVDHLLAHLSWRPSTPARCIRCLQGKSQSKLSPDDLADLQKNTYCQSTTHSAQEP